METKRIEDPATGNQPEPVEPPLSVPPPPGLPLYMADLGARILQRINQTIDRHTRIYTGMWRVKGKRISCLELSRRTAIPNTTLRSYLNGEYALSMDVADRLMHAMGWTLANILTPSEYHDILGLKKVYPQRVVPKKTLRRGPKKVTLVSNNSVDSGAASTDNSLQVPMTAASGAVPKV